MASRAGLVGIYQPPNIDNSQHTSVYMIADDSKSELFIFILFPGAYNDAYEIASRVWYRNIFIIPVSLEGLYVSDVARLVKDLAPIKPLVKVLYPGKFSAYVPTIVQKALIDSSRTTYYQYNYGFISFDYRIGDVSYQPNFHDIYATFKRRRCLFCPFEVDKTRILKMLQNDDVDWVYVPYNDTLFGLDCYATLMCYPEFEPYMDKIIAFGFSNDTEANYCKGRYPKSFPRTIRTEFLTVHPSTESGNPPVTGGEPTLTDKDIYEDNLPEAPPEETTTTKPPYPKPLPEDLVYAKTEKLDKETLIEIPK